MKYFIGATALFAAAVSADIPCPNGGTDSGGNWYCSQVDAITYNGVGAAGSYNRVTSMDSSGSCSSTPFSYSGNVAPLDEEVSWHFRGGNLNLKQFAVYTPAASASETRRSPHDRRHGHAHAHLHHARHASPVEERQVGSEVVATIDGKVVSWVNEYTGQPTGAAAPAPAAAAPTSDSAAPAPASGGSGSSTYGAGAEKVVGGGWARQAYYDSESATSQGLIFLNHNGGSGSGVFDYVFGNSLSYASADGTSGSATPQTLADTMLPSSAEVVIMTDEPCGANNGDCGYYRDGTVAYHGFKGAQKAFFFEFAMPSSGETSASEYDPVNMPAIWMLNALIPRTLQYGNEECSCWIGGCGEFDAFEVLAPGDARMKSTLHGNIAGGDSDYFARPLSGTMKAAVIMNGNSIHLKVLHPDTTFGPSLATNVLNSVIGSTLNQGSSVFQLSG